MTRIIPPHVQAQAVGFSPFEGPLAPAAGSKSIAPPSQLKKEFLSSFFRRWLAVRVFVSVVWRARPSIDAKRIVERVTP